MFDTLLRRHGVLKGGGGGHIASSETVSDNTCIEKLAVLTDDFSRVLLLLVSCHY